MEVRVPFGFAEDCRGQATVELMLALPVILAVAFIAINAMTFFGCAASFDRAFPQMVRVYAQSPGYEEAAFSAAERVQTALNGRFAKEGCTVEVHVSGNAEGSQLYSGILRYEPSLFGFSLRHGGIGVDLATLSHEKTVAISPFRPGVLL